MYIYLVCFDIARTLYIILVCLNIAYTKDIEKLCTVLDKNDIIPVGKKDTKENTRMNKTGTAVNKVKTLLKS